MSLPRVAVLIPTHDRPDVLPVAISSVLDNGYPNVEIVVSDDTPAGTARRVVAALADPRVRYTHWRGPPGRIANSTNASRNCSPEARYHFKLDDDDVILPGFLAKTVGLLERHPEMTIAFTGYRLDFLATGEQRSVVDRQFFRAGIVSGADYCRGVFANEGGYPNNQKTAGVYRQSVAERFGYYDGAPEDFAFSVAVAAAGSVGYIPEVLYVWNSHAGSSSTQDLFPMFLRSRQALEKLRELPVDALSALPACEWRRLITVCEDILPSYYLLATPARQVPRLWRRMLQHLSGPQRRTALPVACAASLMPLPVRDRIKQFYARHCDSPPLRLVRRIAIRR